MPQIQIDRLHGLPLPKAQAMAKAWAQAAQDDYGMQTQQALTVDKAEGEHLWHFKRTGAQGTLRVTPERFVLDVSLGFLLGTFKNRIEAELLQNLDALLAGAE